MICQLDDQHKTKGQEKKMKVKLMTYNDMMNQGITSKTYLCLPNLTKEKDNMTIQWQQ